jgi:uncharacterized membrane protein YkvA (DUF1232 family)
VRVVIDLSEKDLDHFRAAMRRARETAQHLSPEEITGAAVKLLEETRNVPVPDFVADKMRRLDTMISMANDKNWNITEQERKEILSALTYFSDPNDAIPDNIPVLGYLDDAIMIELVCEELRHELDAYEDFCQFRTTAGAQVDRNDWLEQRQEELLDRMRSRRSRDRSYGGSASFSLFSMS